MSEENVRKQFQERIWPYLATVLRTAQILTRDPGEAEDLAQETMLKALRAMGRLGEVADVKAWLMTILRNTRIDWLRSARRKASVGLEGVAEPADEKAARPGEAEGAWANPEDLLQRFSDQEVIDALHELPEEIRWTLLLVDVEGMDHRDAAEVLEVPVGTIKSRVHRGRGMLREALKEKELPTNFHESDTNKRK